MISERREADANKREETDVAAFIAVAALIVGTANMSFQQGQSNPDANSFFQSSSHIVHDSYVD